ncbi:MAG: T9SS type A sorting domain-containing protein [Ferruginibacter sp.]
MKKIILSVCFLYAGIANASIFNVTSSADAGAGTLRQAILDANADVAEPHTLNITFTGTLTLNSNLPAITRSLTINGNTSTGTTISGNSAYSIFIFNGIISKLVNVTLNDLELKDAFSSGIVTGDYGSAIHATYMGKMAINRCYIHHCRSVVSNNGAFLGVHGGAIAVSASGSCSTTSVFYMRQTTVAYNLISGTNAGGGVEAYGAGLYTTTFNDTIENCTFYGNKVLASTGKNTSQATATGGGLAFYGCSISVNHSSFISDTAKAENTAGGASSSGAGGLSTIKYSIDIRNSLADLNIADNNPDIGTLSNGLGDLISKGSNVIGTLGGTWPSKLASDTVNTVTGVQPMAGNGGKIPTCAIIGSSAAVNKVSSGILLTTDGRNYSRDATPDAGAYELSGILPLKLLSFTASVCNTQVCLKWGTAEENLTKNFVVQRSADGIVYTSIATVNAFGNGSHDYAAADIDPLSGIGFYRLQMNDKDGKFTYSNIVSITKVDAGVVSILPNPAVNYFTINNTGIIRKVSLVQNDGRIIKQWSAITGYKYFINNILPGLYTVKIETTTGSISKKLLIVK